jgi:hypothetical protein
LCYTYEKNDGNMLLSKLKTVKESYTLAFQSQLENLVERSTSAACESVKIFRDIID